jgi:hypothetical protein
MFFGGCLAFSLFSAIGFAASSRGAVTGSREAVSLRYHAAERELREIKERVTSLEATRPRAVIEAAIARGKRDRYWSSSNECKDATVEASRAFCRGIGDLRVQLAAAVEDERLQERGASLKAEPDNLLGAGARNDQDQQAALLARLTGFGMERVQTSIVALFAVLVEFGSAFGCFWRCCRCGAFRGWRRSRQRGNIQPRWHRLLRCGRCAATDRRVSRGPLTAG